MSTWCTRCDGTGFVNLYQIDGETLQEFDNTGNSLVIEKWISENDDHDVSICDCCGDGEGWHGLPGEHYNGDIQGPDGPYNYNGGLCECH